MQTSQKGIEFIKSFENFKPTQYHCSAGVLTIGYGHAIKQGENFKYISHEEGDLLLKKDLSIAEASVYRNITAPLEQAQFDALVSFAFNLGGGALQRSTLRQKINYGSDTDEIHSEFLKWSYAGGRKLIGLLRRREAEASMYIS